MKDYSIIYEELVVLDREYWINIERNLQIMKRIRVLWEECGEYPPIGFFPGEEIQLED